MQYDFDKFTISYSLLFHEKYVIKRHNSNIIYAMRLAENAKENIL